MEEATLALQGPTNPGRESWESWDTRVTEYAFPDGWVSYPPTSCRDKGPKKGGYNWCYKLVRAKGSEALCCFGSSQQLGQKEKKLPKKEKILMKRTKTII